MHTVLQPPVRNSAGRFERLKYCRVKYEWMTYHENKNKIKKGALRKKVCPQKTKHKEKSSGVSGVLTLKVENQPVCLQQSHPLSAALQKPPKPQIEFKAATSRLSYRVSAGVRANIFNCVSRRCRARTKPATV